MPSDDSIMSMMGDPGDPVAPAPSCASSFAERLKKAMEMHDLSQVEFADKSGVSPMEINHWVSGRREPSIGNLAKLLNTLPNVRIGWLITGEELQHNAELSDPKP